MKLGETSVPLGGRLIINGDALIYKGPLNRKLTFGKEYSVHNCWSSVVQLRCDTGRLVVYYMGWFERP